LFFFLSVAAIKNNDLRFPGFDRIKMGRDDREAFEFSLEHLMKGVGSYKKWGIVVGTAGRSMHDWLSVSDEAWFLLVIENYEQVWRGEMEGLESAGGVRGTDDEVAKAKWTGKDKNNNRRGKGKDCFVFVIVCGCLNTLLLAF
jgi:hypothetical protein